MNIFKLHITFWFSLHNIDWRTIMCPYLCELGISSTLLKSLSESKADKVAVLVLTESGSRASASLKGWNIVFGHTSQFNLDHMLWPGYRDVVTFRLPILTILTMCFDLGIVTCGPNEALVISGMFQGNTPSLLTGFLLKEIWLKKALFLL